MNRCRQIVEVLFHRRRHRVQPVHGADEIVERLPRCDIFDAKRKDGDAVAHRAFHFFRNVPGSIGVRGKNQHHHFGAVNRFNDGFAVRGARDDVPRRDPAANAGRFEAHAYSVGNDFIF